MDFAGAIESYIISHTDYVISAAVGCLLVPALIYFGSKDTIVSDRARAFFNDEADESMKSQKKKTKRKKDDNNRKIGDHSKFDALDDDENACITFNEDAVLRKAEKLTAFGFTEEQIKKVVKETNDQLKKGEGEGDVTSEEDNISWKTMIDTIVFFTVVVVVCHGVNQASQGDLGRMAAGLFPKEAAHFASASARFHAHVDYFEEIFARYTSAHDVEL
jgi:hypothetical protein